MWDPNIRDWFNALSADVIANCVLAELGVDQRSELGSALECFSHLLTGGPTQDPLEVPPR